MWFLKTPLLLTIWLTLTAASAGEPQRFRRLTVADGLPENSVYAIEQDNQGFIWLGTQNGMARYDGINLKIYRHDPHNGGLTGREIRHINADGQGNLWIRASSAGVNRLDLDTDRVTLENHTPHNPNSLSHPNVNDVAIDGQGRAWIATDNGLNRYDQETGGFIRLGDSANTGALTEDENPILCLKTAPDGSIWAGTAVNGLVHFPLNDTPPITWSYNPANTNSPSSNRVETIAFGAGGTVWFSGIGLNRLDPDSGQIQRIPIVPDEPQFRRNHILHLAVDHDGDVWCITEDGGLDMYDTSTQTFNSYRHNPEDPQSLSSNIITSFWQDSRNRIWVGTWYGLNRFDKPQQRFLRYMPNPNRPKSVGSEFVRKVYETRSGAILVGSWLSGLSILTDTANRFQTLSLDPFSDNSLSSRVVSSLLEEQTPDGPILWAGTSGGGINRIHRDSGRITTIRADRSKPNRLRSDWIRTLHRDRLEPDILWIGTMAAGVHRYNTRTDVISPLPHGSNKAGGLSHADVFNIYQDRAGVIWVGTLGGGINRYNRDRATFTAWENAPGDRNHGGNRVTSMYEDEDGVFWVGTDHAFTHFDRQTKTYHDYDTSNGFHTIQDIHGDDNPNHLWLASYLGGLYLFDKHSGPIRHFTQKDGLAHESLLGILEDGQGMFWISTENGISHFDPVRHTFKTYDKSDGLQGNRFFYRSFFKSPSGEMFFGGYQGLSYFHPKQITTNTIAPQAAVTQMRVGSQPSLPGRFRPDSTGQAPQVRLNHDQNNLGFQFTGIHLEKPTANTTAYRMLGQNDQWINAAVASEVAYNNLAPGSYRFQVKAANSDGIWSEEPAEVELIIAPPFWATTWFHALEILGALMLIGALYAAQRRRLERQNREQIMQLALDQETRERELAQAASQSKTRFLANMSHEIRSPLNAIVGFAQILMRQAQKHQLPHSFRQYLSNIQVSGENLTEIINNILDLSKIEAGKMVLSHEDINLKLLVQSMYHINRAKAQAKGVQLSYHYDPALTDTLRSDRTKLNQILMNLLDNAVKFTPEGGAVKLQALRNESRVILRVEDQGIGIAKERQAHVFEAFEQADGSTTRQYGGTGLGLAITAKMAELLGGTIHLESTQGKGSVFTLSLPYEQALGETVATQPDWIQPHFNPNARILVADDNTMNQDMITALFEELDLTIHIAQDGEEAVSKALDLQPHLVLMDMHMPVVDGVEAVRRIKAHPNGKHIPIAAFSANAFKEQQNQAFQAGVTAYLTKPLEMEKLIPLLANHLPMLEQTQTVQTNNSQSPPDPEREQEILNQLAELEQIPHFLTSRIMDKINHIRGLCAGAQSPYPALLQDLEAAHLSKDVDRAAKLLAEVLHGQPSDH